MRERELSESAAAGRRPGRRKRESSSRAAEQSIRQQLSRSRGQGPFYICPVPRVVCVPTYLPVVPVSLRNKSGVVSLCYS